ncbi:HNH endonuclease [Winogradskyella sp.]|jgi:predicted DNA binding protein|uniref:HNH endonuclease n=1 Tax=Winogradskyella sp. TaxID=1883156 RepID=UPI0025D552A2|nr:HNH endonuclease [Winogradskyella sp.]MCT4630838.1 HNH endonuclease [Winogradskyella sp.]
MIFENVKNYRGEAWKIIAFPEEDSILPTEIIYISNYGRLVKLIDDEPKIYKPYLLNKYPHIKVKTTERKLYRGYMKYKYKGYYLHKLVAQTFLEQPEDAVYVIHLDYDKLNNEARNLKWATKREKELHQWENPVFIASKENQKRPYSKLTENNVRLIKKMLNDPNRRTRLKIIAKRFGISTMQLQRIKTGENWGDIPSL